MKQSIHVFYNKDGSFTFEYFGDPFKDEHKRMLYVYYTYNEALKNFRSETGLQGKQLTIYKHDNIPANRIDDKIITTELKALSQKSFYGKAKIHFKGSWIYLQSYDTIVCSINKDTKTLRRHWDSWSRTTSNHVNDFMLSIGFDHGISKQEWLSIPATTQDLY